MTTPSPPTAPTAPRHGGIHPTYGVYLGGAPLDDSYQTISGRVLFRFSSQRRTEKTLAAIERKLMDDRDSTTSIKFDGKLEAPVGSSNKVGKERFVQLLKQRVKEHGQQSFYHICDANNKAFDLVDNAHWFNLAQVVAEYDRQNAAGATADHYAYNQYALDDIEVSRLVVDSLLLESFCQKIEVQFNHRPDYEYVPGSFLFMMSMDTCNASVSHDVEGA